MKLYVALAIIALPTMACAQDTDRSWHLLVRTRGGTISLLKDLTKHECQFASDRALGYPATDEEKAALERNTKIIDDGWEEWKAEHNCKGLEGGTTRPSYKMSDGMCFRGGEFNLPGEWLSRANPDDIKSAECFQ